MTCTVTAVPICTLGAAGVVGVGDCVVPFWP